MDLAAYQTFTATTATYPEVGTGRPHAISYCVVAAAGEMGELAEKIEAARVTILPALPLRAPILLELGDVLYYVARLATECGFALEAPTGLGDAETYPGQLASLARVAVAILRFSERHKKTVRDQGGFEALALWVGCPFIQAELPRAIHALGCLSASLGWSLEDVMAANVAKLTLRKAAGTIHGSGDYR